MPLVEMSWKREKIIAKIRAATDRSDDLNLRQYNKLQHALQRMPAEDAFEALYAIFQDGSRPHKQFLDQYYAGKLLLATMLPCPREPISAIRAILPNYDPNIADLPSYFAAVYGQTVVIQMLEELASKDLTVQEQRGLQAFGFWLSGEDQVRELGERQALKKFAVFDAYGNVSAYDYGDRFFREQIDYFERLVIGASRDNVELLDTLAGVIENQDYFVLYVLLLSHVGRKPGRYQSPLIECHEDLQLFLYTFREFLEGDGRHHLWIGSPGSADLLVYDQHDIIFAYGGIDRFEQILRSRGFTYEEFWFPTPHGHSYPPSNSHFEDKIMTYFDWQYSELQEGDSWDQV